MNVISILENLLGLSLESSSAGSFLQLKSQVRFQHEVDNDQTPWPRSSYWIVGRELLLFHYLDLSEIPKSQRAKVVAQKIGQLSPFDQTGHYMVEKEGEVMLWFWDQRLQESAIQNAVADFSALQKHILSLEIVPEPVLRQRSSQGLVKRLCAVGEDQQEWRDNVLVASHWYPGIEDAEAAFMEAPWDLRDSTVIIAREPLIWRSGLLILMLAIVYQLGVSVGYLNQKSTLSKELVETRKTLSELAQVRGEVRRVKIQNARILEEIGRFDQLLVLAEFDSLIPDSASITEWHFRNGRLSVQLEDIELDNRDYLERLATSQLFSSAQIAPGSDAQSALVSLEVGPL